MEFGQLGGSGFNDYLSLLASAGFRGAKSVADSVVSEGSSLCFGGAHQVRKGWSLRLRREKAKAGAFAYGGKRQRLEPSLTAGKGKGWSLCLQREKAKTGAIAYSAQPPDDEVRFRRHRLTNASVR